MTKKVSVIVPNFNGKKYLNDCLASLQDQDMKEFEIIVVDDCSEDDAFELAEKTFVTEEEGPEFRFIKREKNGGFSACVNTGINAAESDYILLVNNDTVATPSFVRKMYLSMKDLLKKKKKIFSVSAKMVNLYEQDKLDDTGDFYCALGWAFTTGKDKDFYLDCLKRKHVFSSCGGAALYRREVLLETGLFDENHFAYLEDVDLGYRARLLGYDNVYEPSAVIYHAGSGVSGSRHNDFKVKLTARNNLYLIYKNMPFWQIVVNFPLLLAGILIKAGYFYKKDLLKPYLQGLCDGFKLIKEHGDRQVDFSKVPLSRQILLEGELIYNCIRRLG